MSRFIIDDCGTLIDMETRNTYDYVDEVCSLLEQLYVEKSELELVVDALKEQNLKLKLKLDDVGVEYL